MDGYLLIGRVCYKLLLLALLHQIAYGKDPEPWLVVGMIVITFLSSLEIKKTNQPKPPQTQTEKARELDAKLKGLKLKKALLDLEIRSVGPPERK